MPPSRREPAHPGQAEPGAEAPARARQLSLGLLHELNERCIEMLVDAARKGRPGGFSLVGHLKDQLLQLTPPMRSLVAHRAVLLVDLEFANAPWWRELKHHPARAAPLPKWRGSFPRAAGVQLTRATLMLAWHTVRTDPQQGLLLGIAPSVAAVLASLSLTEIDHIAEGRFRHLRPRWEDRPAVWQVLLRSAERADLRRTREFNLYSLQLLTGELWEPAQRRAFP